MSHQAPIDQKSANTALIVAGVIIALFVIGLITNGFGLFSRPPSNNNSAYIPLEIGQAPVLGNADAPVTIYEFSDFSCPYCGAAAGYRTDIQEQLKAGNPNWEPALKKLKETYINEGKVKLVFKYANGHGQGTAAHKVAWCLNEQNLFWQFHDLAFANQADTGSLTKMQALAYTAGAKKDLLDTCLSSKKYDSLLAADDEMAASNGVSGTPSFFINGKIAEGAISFTQMKELIEQELS
ncbi:MAG TPA: thioredoxin domain-containing protein [Candidatus Nanoarchaeia archaeon]|nr:thioredoxin domain-containing protein [Candidatus Nanoarchaeia archaeon]